MKKNLFTFLILISIFSCSQNNLVDITSKIVKTSGFVDIALTITDKKETDSMFVYTAQGLYKSDTVGIEIALKKGLKAGIVNGELNNVFVRNGITMHSIGSKSDKLLAAIAELYGGIDSIKTMRPDLMILSCANFNQQDVNYTSGEYKFKVFMETATGNPELLINFDFTNKLILLNEKDVEYRIDILQYLMKK
jgi:hypothetical protein